MSTTLRPAPRHAENNLRDAWRKGEAHRIAQIVDAGWIGWDAAGVASRLGADEALIETMVADGRRAMEAHRLAVAARRGLRVSS